MKTNTITVGAAVERLGSSKEYTTGRTGEVLEINEVENLARVLWKLERDGQQVWKHAGNGGRIYGIRTWVRISDLKAL